MVSVSYKKNYTKLNGADSCKDFTGLRVIYGNGSVKYISAPFTWEKKGTHVYVNGAYGETAIWSNDEFSKARLDALVSSNDDFGGLLPVLAKGIIPLSQDKSGETEVTYTTPLLALDAPMVTAIIGDDGVGFSVAILSYSLQGFTFYSFDETGNPHKNTGSAITSKIKYIVQ